MMKLEVLDTPSRYIVIINVKSIQVCSRQIQLLLLSVYASFLSTTSDGHCYNMHLRIYFWIYKRSIYLLHVS